MYKFLVYVLMAFATISCVNKNKGESKAIEGFDAYVSAYTNGLISSSETVKIRFADDIITNLKKGAELSSNLYNIKPNISGKLYLTDKDEIEFIPNKKFKNGENYTFTLRVGELIKVPSKYKKFNFDFSIIKQSFSISSKELKMYADGLNSKMYLKTKFNTADYLSPVEAESIVNINELSDIEGIHWNHSTDGRVHTFVIDSISKLDKTRRINIVCDGTKLGIEKKEEIEVEIPAKGEFYLLDVKPERTNNKQFKILFSTVIDTKQDLRGFIKLEGYRHLKYSISSNEIIVYSDEVLTGERKLNINSGIQSALGTSLKSSYNMSVAFEEIKPQVKFIGKGVISPSENGLIIPFSSVGLSKVELRVIKIFENNIHQFFQSNQYDRSENLRRTGRLILQKKINIKDNSKVSDLRKWNDYRINLADYIELDKGAIYRLELIFRKEYAVCNEEEKYKDIDRKEEFNQEQASWDIPGWYSDYYYPKGYRWNEKENPHHISYYNSSHFASKNVFVSSIGIIAKSGEDNKMRVYVSDLKTTDPLRGVKLSAYNYQKQKIATAKTDVEGMCQLSLDNKAFLLIAEKGDEKAYLRVDDGSSLSVSNFDVSGEKIQKGLKGFIYGERGVWRPGDDIYVSFILEDKENVIPEHHPITAKLFNSKGQEVLSLVKTKIDKPIYCFKFKTDKEAPTGNWNVEIRVGGAVFSKRLKVETIKPNRLKINMKVDGDRIKLSQQSKLNIKTAWLHGAKATNLKIDVKIGLSKMKTSFDGYSNYHFDDYSRNFWFNDRVIFEGKTNKTGELNLPIKLGRLNNATGFLKANIVTRVFEKTGDFSISSNSFQLSPYKSYVGMEMPSKTSDWYKTSKDYKVRLVTITEDGKPISRNITAEIYSLGWRWWWDSNNSDIASYVNSRYNKKVSRHRVKTVNGKASFNLNIKKDGRYYVRFYDEQTGSSCGQTVYFSNWGGFDLSDIPGGASILSLSPSKRKYEVGEEVVVNIPSSKDSRALVSIESGSRIIKQFTVKTDAVKTSIRFKATQEMSPNAYVNVSLIQAHKNTDNDHPMRLYGVSFFKVYDKSLVLNPVIKQAKELRPEKDFEIEVSEKNARAMTYTVAIIDEGLLDITSFRTPNPYATFYARESLGIKTWDMYDYVLGAYGARLENAFAIGGDEDLKNKSKKRVNRFKPVVIFKGPFTLKAGKRNKHKFSMPNYIGSVKTMVVAAEKGAYGSVEVTSEVKKPLMILASLPRVLTPKDRLKLPVTVFAMSKKIKNVTLRLKVNDKIKIIGGNTLKLTFNETGEQIAEFNIEVNEKIGKGDISITATSGNEKASYDTYIDVRLPNPPITKVDEEILNKKGSCKLSAAPIGIKGTNSLTLEISSFPTMNLSKRLEYLIDYPHGCLEQTISSVFPQLYLSKLTNLSDQQLKNISLNVNAAISKLMRFQTVDGGFTYWSGGDYMNSWANIYAGHFMIMAEKMGYNIPVSMRNRWLRFTKNISSSWNDYGKYYNSELTQAYRLYVLALFGEEQIGAMNRMREKVAISHQASWQLASAYAIAGKTEVAEKLISNLSYDVKPYREWSNTFGSSLRDRAMILDNLCIMNKSKEAFKLAVQIAKSLGEDSWMSTQTIAFSLYSISQCVGKFSDGKGGMKFEYTINGKKFRETTNMSMFSKKIDIDNMSKCDIEVKNLTESNLFVSLVSKGVPVRYEEEQESTKLKLNVVYRDTKGYVISPDSLIQGTDFVAEIRIANDYYTKTLEQLALTVMLPSGWEIANNRLYGGKDDNKADFIDIRDDRMNFYFSLGYKKTKTFKININASYKGEYYLPAISCQAMYDNDVSAVVKGGVVRVVGVK